MTPEQKHEMIAQILDRADADDLRSWAWSWLEMHPKMELREVYDRVVPTPDPGLPHILAEDVAP